MVVIYEVKSTYSRTCAEHLLSNILTRRRSGIWHCLWAHKWRCMCCWSRRISCMCLSFHLWPGAVPLYSLFKCFLICAVRQCWVPNRPFFHGVVFCRMNLRIFRLANTVDRISSWSSCDLMRCRVDAPPQPMPCAFVNVPWPVPQWPWDTSTSYPITEGHSEQFWFFSWLIWGCFFKHRPLAGGIH